MEINKDTVGSIIAKSTKVTNGVVKEDYTKIMNIKLRDPDNEYRSSIIGITMDGEVCQVEGYMDLPTLFEQYYFKRNKMESRFGKVGKKYPMGSEQPAQIDCRVISCLYYGGSGQCTNVSPAITLNEGGMFTCWSKHMEII